MKTTTAEEALATFDSLEPVDIRFMIGSWKGDRMPLPKSPVVGRLFQLVMPLLYTRRPGPGCT